MSLNDIKPFIEAGGLGIVSLFGLSSLGILWWMIKRMSKQQDECNERVERLVNSHVEFVRSHTTEAAKLMAHISHLTNRIEEILDKLVEVNNR